MNPENTGEPTRDDTPAYEPPCIETVLTSDDLEREALYAGTGSLGPDLAN